MTEYTDKSALYEKIAQLEELARNRYLETPSNSPAYPRYTAQMQERTALKHLIADFPAVDAVPAEKYDELREMFVDYVCSGVSNPAPYCKNRCAECLDRYGWCRNGGENCAGFDPDKEDNNDGR